MREVPASIPRAGSSSSRRTRVPSGKLGPRTTAWSARGSSSAEASAAVPAATLAAAGQESGRG